MNIFKKNSEKDETAGKSEDNPEQDIKENSGDSDTQQNEATIDIEAHHSPVQENNVDEPVIQPDTESILELDDHQYLKQDAEYIQQLNKSAHGYNSGDPDVYSQLPLEGGENSNHNHPGSSYLPPPSMPPHYHLHMVGNEAQILTQYQQEKPIGKTKNGFSIGK